MPIFTGAIFTRLPSTTNTTSTGLEASLDFLSVAALLVTVWAAAVALVSAEFAASLSDFPFFFVGFGAQPVHRSFHPRKACGEIGRNRRNSSQV